MRVHYEQTVRQRASHEEDVNVHGYTLSRQSDNTGHHQGLTLLHFSAQLEPFLTQKTTPKRPLVPLKNP